MRYLCVIPSYWPAFQFGGPIFSVHNLNKALVKKGHEVTVCTTNAGLDNRVNVNQETLVDGVKVNYFSVMRIFDFFGSAGWQFSFPLSNFLKKNIPKFDIIYVVAVWNYTTAITGFYCRKFNKPFIISPRGSLYPYVRNKKFFKKWLYYNLIARRDLQSSNIIHYTTEDEAAQCHRILGLKNRKAVISNGIEPSFFKDLPDRKSLIGRYPYLKNKKVIIFLGRLNWKKGLDILLGAYKKIIEERDDVYLILAGNGEDSYRNKINRIITEFRIKDKIVFLGMLNGKEKMEAYAVSDIFVLPSYSENFGMSAVEAMSCGIPVIVSDQVGIHKDIIAANAGIVIKTEIRQLHEAIMKLLDDGKLRVQLGINGRMLVRTKFTIDRIADEMVAVCASLLQNS